MGGYHPLAQSQEPVPSQAKEEPNTPAGQSTVKIPEDGAVVIDVKADLSPASLATVREGIEQALEKKAALLVFRFSGRGRSFEAFSELGREIARLPERGKVHTIAYVPREALGMSVLGVFACREIIADEFAQIGQVIPPAVQRDAEKIPIYDEQAVINKLESLCRASDHEALLARAMAQKRLILYQIGRADERKLVDQTGFERFTQQSEAPWQMVGTGPLTSGDEVLLLSGRRGKELGLVSRLAASEEELEGLIGTGIIDIREYKTEKPPIEQAVKKEKTKPAFADKEPKAVFIIVEEMVDEGLYESIKRRTEAALQGGANYLIYEIDTFGGRVDSAIAIYDYILQDVSRRARTIAYIPSKAISAGALISVACQDIIMKKATKLGDCAPISLGGTLEGVEREKIETVLRSYFTDAAQINGYPGALCRAMVSAQLEVYRVKNEETGKYEFFEKDKLPDNYPYDYENRKLIDKEGELLTLTADEALEYGLARTVVEGLAQQAKEEVLAFLEGRDGVKFERPVATLETNWSEELVRWLTSPMVAGILLTIALLGIYAELNSPGLGLPGAIAVTALVILFGSKYLIGMANWWEIALFLLGLVLLLLEIFVIPGFGIAGISGALMMLFALGAMMVPNRPDEWPIPASPVDWDIFHSHLVWAAVACMIFIVLAYFIGRFLPKIPVANRLVLTGPVEPAIFRSGGAAGPAPSPPPVKVGQEGVSLSQLRPSGNARFGRYRLTVVTRGELVEAKRKIKVVAIEGNSIVVKEVEPQEEY